MTEPDVFAARNGAQQPAADGGNGAPVFTKVHTRRGFEYIYEQIRNAVTEGKFRPGDRLPPEREMAQIFGVSRQGVREALRGLEMNGLIESRPGVTGGVFIKPGDTQVVTRAMTDLASLGTLSSESLLEARILLCSDIIRLACERATAEDLKRLEEDIEFTRKQNKTTEAGVQRTAEITEFYRLLAMASHNEVLVMLTDSLAQIVRARLNRVSPAPRSDVVRVRRNILGYLRAGDADKAIDELTRHLKRLEKMLVSLETPKQEAAQ